MKNRSIRSRVNLSSAVIAVLLTGLAGLATFQFSNLGRQTEELSVETGLFMGASRMSEKASAMMRIPAQAAAGGGETREAYRARYQNLLQDLEKLESLPSKAGSKSAMAECRKKLEAANGMALRVFTALEAGKKDDAMVEAILVEEYSAEFFGTLRKFNMDTSKALEVRMSGVKSQLVAPLRILIAASIVTIVLAMLANAMVLSGLKPIQRIVDVLQAASSGNYRERIEVSSHDEVGKIGASVNELMDRVESSLEEVRELAARERMQVAERLRQQKQTADEEARRANERKRRMDATLQAITASTSAAAVSSLEMKQSVSVAAESVSMASRQIGQAVDLISNIAFSTHLLALNAAIEAARAGQAGLGFAVVADEVKGLAAQASSGAEAIIKNLEDIRSGSAAAAAAASKVDGVILQVNGISASMNAAVQEQVAV